MPPKTVKKPPAEKGAATSTKKPAAENEKKRKASKGEVVNPKCRKGLNIPKKLTGAPKTSVDVNLVMQWALMGKTDCDYPETSKIVRIFTSSTFTGSLASLLFSAKLSLCIVWVKCHLRDVEHFIITELCCFSTVFQPMAVMSCEYTSWGASNHPQAAVCFSVCSGLHNRKHQCSTLLALCVGNPLVTSRIRSQRSVIRKLFHEVIMRFADTRAERNALMARVYPKLREYCRERGYDFQVVDMRWGVRDESTDDHLTSELCMRELQKCQRLSTGPNFIVS